MAIEARLENLVIRHKELEEALNEEVNHAAFDDVKVHQLKRRKLAIKDEMETLKSQMIE